MNSKTFHSKIRHWYRRNKHQFNFPWRRTRDPYKILVSEIMLQQTQISRVLPKYRQWLEEFPTVQRLASSPFSKILQMWHGLGYNRRSRYLKTTAEAIVRDYQGRIPSDPRVLEKLPGIGPYTSRAIACFAYGRCESFLDTNIRRVFIHFFMRKLDPGIRDQDIITLMRRHTPKRATRDWYYALMDYGREALGKRQENPNRLWRGYAKQSPFLGSRRYIRAKIVSTLLEKPQGRGYREIHEALAQEPRIRPFLVPEHLSRILKSLEKDRLIFRSRKCWMIAS